MRTSNENADVYRNSVSHSGIPVTAKILKGILDEGLKINGRKRNALGKNDDRVITSGDFIRGTADYNMRHVCRMTPSECCVMHGIGREDIYGIYYVDWNNIGVLYHMRAKLERWHKRFMATYSGSPTAGDELEHIYHLKGKIKTSTILIRSIAGVDVYVQTEDSNG